MIKAAKFGRAKLAIQYSAGTTSTEIIFWKIRLWLDFS